MATITRSATVTESLWKVGAGATAVAAVLNSVVFSLTAGPAGVDFRVDQNGTVQSINVVMVIVITLVVGALATGVAALLDRTKRGAVIFGVLGVLFTVLSLGGVVGGVTTATKVSLASLHLLTAIVIAGGLTAVLARRRQDRTL